MAAAVLAAGPALLPTGAAAVTFQGEELTRPAGDATRVVADPGASGRRALRIDRDVSASISFTTRGGHALVLHARGTDCDGAPQVRAVLDGRVVADRAVAAGGEYKPYFAAVRVERGEHKLEVSLTNDHWRPRRCDRGVTLDKVGLVESAPLGAAVDWDRLEEEPPYEDAYLANFDQLTPENAMKMERLQPLPGDYRFGEADRLVRFASRNSRRVRGHALVWGHQLAHWVRDGKWTRRKLLRVMLRHVSRVVRHFGPRVAEWDVVNEPLNENGRYKRNVWFRAIGPDYIARALHAARRANPKAKLFLNEGDIELRGPHQDALFELARSLLARGVPLDGIGFQAHLTNRYYATTRQWRRALRRFARLGLDVAITEMDVRADTPGTDEEKLAQQRKVYEMAARACRREPRCTSFTVWGVTDKYSWLGEALMPPLLDSRYERKPAYEAVVRSLTAP